MEKIRIVIVDDSPFSIALLRDMLEEKGYEVVGDAGSLEEVKEVVKDKKPTLESLNKTLSIISEQAGHAGRIEGAYIESDKFKEMKNYAESKIAENANSKRKEYSLRNNNCGTFAADVLKQDPSVKDKAPVIIDPRPNSIVKEYQDNFKSLNYDPKKRQVKIE